MRFDRWGPVDTSPEADRALFAALRRLGPARRLQRAASHCDLVRSLQNAGRIHRETVTSPFDAPADDPDGPARR